MKDRNTDYNLLDLIESSSKVRKQSQEEPASDVEISEGSASERNTARCPVAENEDRNTRSLKPVATQETSDDEVQATEEKRPFFKHCRRS